MSDEILINVLLLSNGPTQLMAKLQEYEHVDIEEVYQIGNFDYSVIKNKTNIETFVVIDQSNSNSELVVFTSLFIRNFGRQVFITCPLDIEDLVEVMNDIFIGIRNDPTLRPEIIITERASANLGDVTPIVKRFEQENL